MNLKIKHIVLMLTSILLVACAMEAEKMKSADAVEDIVALDDEENIADFDAKSNINNLLIKQKLQDFYDLISLQNQHPEFTQEVTEQLKNYTNNSITDFKTEHVFVIKNLRQLGTMVKINDSTQKVKLTYNKVANHITTADTIYAIISNKTIMIDGKPLVSNKIRFSKN